MAIALYARKSVEKENSISCETQIEYCRAMIKPDERNLKVLTFVDNGFSGGNVNRDGFQKMMQTIKQGKITKVLVYRLDRISRSLSDFVNILNTFKEYSVEFVSTQEAFDTSSPYGELIVKILAVFAEFERQSIISRVKQAYEHRSEMGFYMGGRKPYGYDLEPIVINNIKTKRLVPNKDEIEHIKFIYENYAKADMTLGKLVNKLIDSNISPVSCSMWSSAKLSAILKNPVYVKADSKVYEYFQVQNARIISSPENFDGLHGIQIYGKTKHNPENKDMSDIKVVVMSHKGVVDSDTWIKCQKKLENNRQVGKSVSNKTSWLSGKVICYGCQRTMTTIKGKTASGQIRRYFVCTGKTNYRVCGGVDITVYAQSLEETVYKEIDDKLKKYGCIRTNSETNMHPEINRLRNKLKKIELDREKIVTAVIQTGVDGELLEILKNSAQKLKKEKKEIIEIIEKFDYEHSTGQTEINLPEKWREATFEEKRAVCNVLINQIIISKDGTVEIVWNI